MKKGIYLFIAVLLMMTIIELSSLYNSTFLFLAGYCNSEPYLMVSESQRNGYSVLCGVLCLGFSILSFAKKQK